MFSRRPDRLRLLVAALLLFMLSAALPAQASVPNRVYRVDIRPKREYTRISFHLESPPRYTLTTLPGNRLRLSLSDTGGSLFRKFRRYSDPNLGGLIFKRRGKDLLVTFQVGTGRGWREVSLEGLSSLALDIGKPFSPPAPHPYLAGRDKIWNGVEKLVRDFDPPLKPEIPFLPSDRQVLKNLLPENEVQSFMAAEAALYKGQLSDAEEAFLQFAARTGAVKALALYRLGETYYKLQKYPQALKAFREGEKLWAAYLNFNPGVTFYYGDSIARGGDLTAARTMLAGLIARLADKKFAPVLLVRLADILVRQGHDREALGLYRTVADNFGDNKANQIALLRLADRGFLTATPWDFRLLGEKYVSISRQSGDIDLREEAYFKSVLLESIHGEAAEALRQVAQFQKKFPRGIYAAVCRTIREVLVALVYRQTDWSADAPALIRFVEEHHDYLAGCLENPEFLERVAKAYDTAGRPIELIKLYSGLLERQWSASAAPTMYLAIAENADLLGDATMVEKSLSDFLRKFPRHPRGRAALERLGALYTVQGKHQQARDNLVWLLNKGERAATQDSYYYLGRSLLMLKQFPQAVRSMDLYLAQAGGQGGSQSALLPDAYAVAISARESTGDRKGALRLAETGLKLPASPRTDELIYRAGELNLSEGRKKVARDYFNRLVKEGKDADWQNLARQALASLEGQGPEPGKP